MGGSEHARAQSGRCSLRVTALEPLTRRSEMPKDLLTRLQRATSAEKVRKHLSNLEDHNVLNSDGDTLLHTYIRRKDKHKKECLLSLLVYGDCDVDAENKQGVTPLHLAAEINDIFGVRALLAFGCEVNCLSPLNHTPLDIAQDAAHEDDKVITLLVSVGGQTGTVTTEGLYVLPTLRLGSSFDPDWQPDGEVIRKEYHGDHPDLGCSPPRPKELLLDPQLHRGLKQKSSKVEFDETTGENGQQASKDQFQTDAYRYQTPDHSVTMGLTLESIHIAKNRVGMLSPSPPPSTVVEKREDNQRSHDESCDLPNGVHDETDNTDEKSHDESCDVHTKSPVRGRATPSNHQPYNDTDSAGGDGAGEEEEGEGEGEGEGEEEEGEGEGEGLVPAVDFSLTQLEMRSLHALRQIEDGSMRAQGYAAWRLHRSKKREASLMPLGSICNRVKVFSSFHKPRSEGENGEESQGLEGEGHVPDAFRVRPGESVLCLDGGGIRGLVQLEILRQIEELTHRRIVDLFDWIVGTSTGGILALGLVYAKMTFTQLHKLYFEMKDRVFSNPTFGLACNTSELESILRERFQEKRMSDTDKPKVLVCAVNKETTALTLTFFNNCFNDRYSDELVWKVARYTSAAPLYFTECDNYVDGGLLANNPCSDALTKIQYHQREHGGDLSLVVSVGCGVYPAAPIGNTDILTGRNPWTLLKAVPKLTNLRRLFITALLGTSESVSDNCRCRCEQRNPPIQYFRFSPKLADIVESIETDGTKLCDLVIQAKQLLHNDDLKLDLLVQHFYYTARMKRGQ